MYDILLSSEGKIFVSFNDIYSRGTARRISKVDQIGLKYIVVFCKAKGNQTICDASFLYLNISDRSRGRDLCCVFAAEVSPTT